MREAITRDGVTVGYFDRNDNNLIMDTNGNCKGRFIECDKCVVDMYGSIIGYYDYEDYVVDRNRSPIKQYDGDPAVAAAILLL